MKVDKTHLYAQNAKVYDERLVNRHVYMYMLPAYKISAYRTEVTFSERRSHFRAKQKARFRKKKVQNRKPAASFGLTS